MSQFFDSIREVKNNYGRYDDWEQLQANEQAQKQYLAKTLEIPQDKVEITAQKAKTVIRAAELLDKSSENNAENMELVTGAIGLPVGLAPIFIGSLVGHKMLLKGTKNASRNNVIAQAVGIGVSMLAGIGMIFWGTAKQKEASRIGRFQAKTNELSDIKNFVAYTPEQIAEAEEKAKTTPDKKENKSFFEAYAAVKEMNRHKKAYLEWEAAKDPDDIKKLKARELTKEQIAEGEKDRELIVDAVKTINIKAEEYSENSENAFDTMAIFSFIPAGLAAWGVNKLLKRSKIAARVPGLPAIVSGAMTLLTPLSIMFWGTSEQKKASAVGRFKARQDLMKDPAALMHYSTEEMQKAAHIKAPNQKKGFVQDIVDDFKFIPVYFKHKGEYKKYVDKEQKHNEKVMDILRESEISEKQLNSAKKLQEKVFLAFDEVDEMSQRYSEDVEAGSEAAKQVFSTAWSLGSLAGMAALGMLAMKGKLPIAGGLKKLTNLTMDPKSNIKVLYDKLYAALGKDKTLKTAFNKFDKKVLMGDPECKAIIEELMGEGATLIPRPDLIMSGKQNIAEAIKQSASVHFKKGPIAIWARNLVTDVVKLKWGRKMVNQIEVIDASGKTVSKLKKQFNLNMNYKNYNTFWNTIAVSGLPLVALIAGVPYAFNAWLTNIQKKAGKIGIMKAMEQIDDPRVFAEADESKA